MKIIPIPALAILVTIGTLLLTSCEDDKPETPAPNFEIASTDLITVQETHENGWIKKAERYNTGRTLKYEFTYYSNGYLEGYRVYKSANNAPTPVLYQEHTRSETDLPLTSRYYDVSGNLYAELLYEDGLLASKVIHHTGTTTTFFYAQGAIQRIEKRLDATDELTRITYTTHAGERTVEITTAGTSPQTVTSTDHTITQGFDISDDAVLLNLLEDKAEYAITPGSVYSSTGSVSPAPSIDVQELNIDLVEYYELEDNLIQRFGIADEARKIKNLLIDEWRRSITEQYPFTEGVVFIAFSNATINQYSLGGGLLDDVMQTTKSLRAQYGDDFEQLYGQGYVTRYSNGKYLFAIGTLRNLPSDPTLRAEIKTIAEKRANDFIKGQSTVTQEELDLLSHVFFQLKVHSNVLNVNGQVIGSSADYEGVVQVVNHAPAPIIHYVLARHFSD